MIRKKIDIFLKFGQENKDNNFYEFYDVSNIRIEKEFLKFEYVSKTKGTINTACFPAYNTWYGIKGDE